jgi:hypothetical protein
MVYESEELTIEQMTELEVFYNIRLPEPSNSLYEEIKEILYLSHKLVPEYGEKASWFEPPTTNEEIEEWEKTHGLDIPESYKEWLRFSNCSQIQNELARFMGPTLFVLDDPSLAKDLVIIGHLIGDGEFLCFSKTTGDIIRYFSHKCEIYSDFASILHLTIEMIKGESSISNEAEDLLLALFEAN